MIAAQRRAEEAQAAAHRSELDWNQAVLDVHRARLAYECLRAAPDATDASLSRAWLSLFLAERRRDRLLGLEGEPS